MLRRRTYFECSTTSRTLVNDKEGREGEGTEDDSRHELKRQDKKTLQVVNALGKSRIQEFELKKEWIDTYKKSIITMQDFVTNPDPSNQEAAINSIRLSLETFLKYCIYIPDPTQTNIEDQERMIQLSDAAYKVGDVEIYASQVGASISEILKDISLLKLS